MGSNRAGAALRLTLPAGKWTAERWDTQAGKVLESSFHEVAREQALELRLHPITWDAALRVRRHSTGEA